jgi:hypothetical protein
MVTSEVQRTLVKSPPELWAELSDPAALARHLGDLGDVGDMRIVRVQAEERVDWEAHNISGSVLMKASGWGTKVTLRVSRELGQIEPPIAEAAEAPEDEPAQTVDAADPEAAADVDNSQAAEAPSEAEPEAEGPLSEEIPSAQEPANEKPTLELYRGFFSRLFRRRRPALQPEPVAMTTASAEPVSAQDDRAQTGTPATMPERPTNPEPVAAEPPAQEPSSDISADLKAAEEVAAGEVTAVLTATLDRLGAAHHRPFSRS